MASAPPIFPTPAHIHPHRFVDRGAFESGMDGGVCIAIESAPASAASTELRLDGSLSLRTLVMGHVTSVDARALEIDHGGIAVTVRTLLPSGVDLSALVGRWISVELAHTCRRGADVTIDAVLRDEVGELILWARDGALPHATETTEARVRVAWGPDRGPRLVLASGRDLATLAARESSELRHRGHRLAALALRVSATSAAFVLARC